MSGVNYNLARSAKTGKVFARFTFDDKQASELAADLSYATTPEALSSVFRLKQIAKQVNDYLYSIHPVSSAGSIKSKATKKLNAHLRDGWRVKVYEGAFKGGGAVAGTGLMGFFLYHKLESFQRIQTVIKSLDTGSEEHTIVPVGMSVLRFRAPYPQNTAEFFARKVTIPRREGTNFLGKTRQYADQLLASQGTQMEALLADIVEKGRRFRAASIGDSEIVHRNATGALFEARKEYGQSFAQQRNPLAAVRAIANRRK